MLIVGVYVYTIVHSGDNVSFNDCAFISPARDESSYICQDFIPGTTLLLEAMPAWTTDLQ